MSVGLLRCMTTNICMKAVIGEYLQS